nr:MAG TPA: hypothetical protein [Caudoviricetes sp.]
MAVVVEPQRLLGLFLFGIIYMRRQSPCIHYGQIRSDAGLFLCYNIPTAS